ncbi:sensor histidine kinase [Autumnicola musiva]|uniref:histidine kinase n=1 Tax=Autumnicola musiva TaxID=3075589 RepID=A0ABU3D637_9FLAO|nr:ATP-binding protein [Zunongwangia sp. F117]MDT0676997.1 ATP-binding protein [Zunongwangia sp. F117]
MMDTQTQIFSLKRKLNEELEKENSDNSVVLSLSHELAKLDNQNVRFSVDAGIINRLGLELVGRHETAVSELVKNAYDADALEVNLIFENAWKEGGKLTIEDNGLGMTREQLINGFMRLSSADKIHNPISGRYARYRAGKKGIGRFSTQRLGTKLTVITQTLESQEAISITIAWNDFESDKELLLISNQIKTISKIKDEGTTLIIEGLRDTWTDAMIKRAYRYTSNLLQPFPLSDKRKKSETDRVDPGFKSKYFRKYEEGHLEPIIDDNEAFFQHALAEVEGFVLDDGQGCWSLKSDKLGFTEEIFFIGKDRNKDKSKFEFIRDIHFKCYYFIYESSLLPTQTLSFIKSVANETGGIRLYRNGFRVLPYGEKGNDWIGLDESTRRRAIIAPHQNNSFFGFVEINDNTGHLFEETASREGLIENEAFQELSDFIYRSITSAVLKVAELRNRKGTAGQRDWEKREKKPAEQEVDEAIFELETLIENEEGLEDQKAKSNGTSDSKSHFKEKIGKLKASREKEKEEKKGLIEEMNMLRILAGLGLVIGEFVHEIDRFLPAFDTDIRYLKRAVADLTEALARTERLDENLKSFSTYTAYFYEAISRNVLRDLDSIELRDVVYEFEDVVQEDIKASNYIFYKPIFEDYDLWTVPMHKSEWASILFNFYINAKKAIKRAESKGQIKIRCGRERGYVFLEFSDDGDGIPVENRDKVFNAFFTTTSAAGRNEPEGESLRGIGLGLKIVKDIVESYGGEILVANPEEGFNTTMRIEIPEKKEDKDE